MINSDVVLALDSCVKDIGHITFKYSGNIVYITYTDGSDDNGVCDDNYDYSIYSSDEMDEDGNYKEDNLMDGGTFNGPLKELIDTYIIDT